MTDRGYVGAPYRDGLSSQATEPKVSAFQASIPSAETEQLVWDAEQSLRALQDRLLEPGDVRTLERLVSRLKEETVQ